jgi:phage terminase small subunit
MKITSMHYEFCDIYLKNGGNAAYAYKEVYPTCSNVTARVNGYKLLQTEELKDYIKMKRQESMEKHNITKDEILSVVMGIMTDEDSKTTDRLKASEILLKALGLNMPEKTELSGGIENKVIKVKYKKESD